MEEEHSKQLLNTLCSTFRYSYDYSIRSDVTFQCFSIFTVVGAYPNSFIILASLA